MTDPPAPDDADVDVSVTVIVYNDAARLPTAVQSVLRQSLRRLEVIIVDDASTDETPRVARELCALDPRVRYVRLPSNSGGCGAPRNAGIAVSRAPYVMFLDSDDRYERHACKNLLEAIEDNQADLASGLARRLNMDSKVQTGWYPKLYQERRVIGGLAEHPELIQDTISVNKIYRRSFLDEYDLRFPDDIHYEDQLFTYQAYHRARVIATIPETVYIWRIFPSHDTHSISHQRHQIDNFRHRLEVNRRIDAYIQENVSDRLRLAKDLKFLEHDMRLYLADVIYGDLLVSKAVIEEAVPYLRAIPVDRYQRLPPGLRAAYGMALRGDLGGVRGVMLYDRQNIVGGRVSEHGGRWYWSDKDAPAGPDERFALGSPENAFCDVTGTALIDAPITSWAMLHELGSIAELPGGSGFKVSGTTFDGLGKLRGSTPGLTLLIKRRRGPVTSRAAMVVTDEGDGRWSWSGEVKLHGDLFSLDQNARWDFEMEVRTGRTTLRHPVLWAGQDEVSARVPGALGRAFSDTVRPYTTVNFRAALMLSPRDPVRFRVARRLQKRVKPTLQKKVVKRWKKVEAKQLRDRFYAAMRRLPLDPKLAVFEAQLGTVYADSPKYVFEELRRIDPSIRCAWVLPKGHAAPAAGVEVVQRGSYDYLRVLARATYLCDNQTFPWYFRKRPGQRYLQTWHGIPLKQMGADIGDRAILSEDRPTDRGVGAWDQLVVPNKYFEDVFVPAFRFTGELVKYGTPRNDPLVRNTVDAAEVRSRLDIPAGKKIVLYAPTFRQPGRGAPVSLPFDAEGLVRGLGTEWVVLLRAHYLNRVVVPGGVRASVIDVSGVEDVNDLYAVADVLVTDYSSVMFDFALLRKPMVFYTYDYEEYLRTRGVYFELKDVAPGPFVETTEDLVQAIGTATERQDDYAKRYEHFLQAYCGSEDGGAARRAALALLGREDEDA